MHIFVVKRSSIIRAAMFLVLVAVAVIYTQAVLGGDQAVFEQDMVEMPVMSIESGDCAALTFDTAFGDDYTEEIMKILDKNNVRATFFVMGIWAQKYPGKVESIKSAGHEIQSHSMYHERYPDLTADEMLDDADAASGYLESVTGVKIPYIRMPFGAYDENTITVLKSEGYLPFKWSLDSKDWKGEGPETVKKNVLDRVKPGDIILFQNNAYDTAEALDEIIAGIKDKGIFLKTISEMMYDNYVIDSDGMLKPFLD